MKNRSLTLVGMFLVVFAVILAVWKTKTSISETKTTEVREVVKAKRPRTTPSPSKEIVTVEYSTKAFLNKGTPETEQQ